MSGISCSAAAIMAAAGSGSGVLTFIDAQIVSNTTGATTVVVPKPVGTASGDLLVAVMISQNGNVAWTQPAGFTEVLDVQSGAFGGASWKVAGGAEGSTYTFTADNSVILVAALVCFRNATFDAIGAVGSQNAAPQAGSITLSGEGLTLAVFASTQGSITFTKPTGCTQIAADSDASAPSMALFRKAVAAGATPVISSVASSGTARGLQIGIKKV